MGVHDHPTRGAGRDAGCSHERGADPAALDARTGPAPETTVLIPTLNDERDIGSCLAALERQTYRDFEVIIVDSHSKDHTPDIARRFGALVVDDDSRTRADACNHGLMYVRTPYVAFTDADCVPPPEWLGNLIGFMTSRDDVDAVGGPNVAPPFDKFFAKCVDVTFGSKVMTGETRYGKIPSQPCRVDHNPGCNAAYRTEVLRAVGGFERGAVGAEDLVLDHRIAKAGYRIWFNPNAVIWHRRRDTVVSFFRQIRNYGKVRALANRNHPDLRHHTHILPTVAMFSFLALVAATAADLALWRTYLPLTVTFACIVMYYLLGLYGSMNSYSPHKEPQFVVAAPIVIGIGHLAWGIGYLEGLLIKHPYEAVTGLAPDSGDRAGSFGPRQPPRRRGPPANRP